MSNPAKIKQFHALLSATGLMDMKADILGGCGVESSKDLSDVQITEVINRLQRMKEAHADFGGAGATHERGPLQRAGRNAPQAQHYPRSAGTAWRVQKQWRLVAGE